MKVAINGGLCSSAKTKRFCKDLWLWLWSSFVFFTSRVISFFFNPFSRPAAFLSHYFQMYLKCSHRIVASVGVTKYELFVVSSCSEDYMPIRWMLFDMLKMMIAHVSWTFFPLVLISSFLTYFRFIHGFQCFRTAYGMSLSYCELVSFVLTD